ncbi:oxidoreductase, short chain dehydrogenase/reductase domain protein [Leptospira fainei serovar Hurstbridge str. BUT 6]|uniref:Oxidoreductase, short chain dehydrogenase/reductase domain protein n=1 Tax=Leptospira fainei serovar Hurstbridge str. BUT 6 TaxID=1193011 RepID=S3UYL4_9LEPT|nr:SDR family NAD(P)-dependent oxidoreductase [Leptospira fainei]EPG74323.1 oxidoreductase, short chain dehydrogenase/reductase domain protein [Leptospira fainei serovar Hurstbridge str. BUT 6]
METHLKEEIALVTGYTAGIGLAIAVQLLNEGAIVFINGRTKKRADDALTSIRKILPNAKVDGNALLADGEW